MNNKMPRTPFSTPLSGSARETELRLKNIFSGPKKRPPVLFLALMFSVCLLCGNLVSFQVEAATYADSAPNRPNHSQTPDASLDLTEHEPASVTYQTGESPLSEGEQLLLEKLFRAAERQNGWQFQVPTAQLMSYIQKDGWVLGAVFVEDHLENTLILGIMDKETGEVPHAIFQRSYHGAFPHVVTFRGDDGLFRLLYTFNGQENGQYTGEAGLVRFDGEFMAWEWPVEGDVRYGHEPPGASPAAYPEYREYWDSGHYAVMAPGGVDVYTVNPDFQWGQDEPWSIWQLDHNETFWYDSSSAEELPMPIYFQSLNWLIEHTNDPGGWRITSLTLNEERCDSGKQVDCYTLRAHTDNGQNELTADLFFPYDQTGGRRSYDTLNYAEVTGEICGYPLAPNTQDGPAVTQLEWTPDLNRNGVPEELRLVELDLGLRLEVLENGAVIHYEEGYSAHAGWNALFLCTLDGENYLLSYSPTMYQGFCDYGYELYTLEGNGKKVVRQNSVSFDINIGSPMFQEGGYDPDAIAGFMEEINGLLSHSVQLLNTDSDLLQTFEKEGRLVDTLWWLDTWEPVFTRAPGKSLLENLADFQDAMVRQPSVG